MQAIYVYRTTVHREELCCHNLPLPECMLINIGHLSLYTATPQIQMSEEEYDQIMEICEEAFRISYRYHA
jgi:hypothetical protein